MSRDEEDLRLIVAAFAKSFRVRVAEGKGALPPVKRSKYRLRRQRELRKRKYAEAERETSP